jgi:type I restriction enzyme S subunit
MLLSHLNLLATAPGGVARLRELILTLAVQGKLVAQDPNDEPASALLKKIRAEKDRLILDGKIKRDKPLAEIAEEEMPFDLPKGWEWVRLNSLLQKIGAGSTPLGGREVYVSSGVKFLRSQNVWDDGLRLDAVAFIKPETHAKMSGTVVFANDLLFNITGASIGRCAVVPSDFDEANVSQHVTIVRTVLPALNAFLHKVLISRHVQQTVMDVQVGVSREGLSIAKLGHFLIPVPPLAEQSRIVTRVEELMRLCEAVEAKGQLEATQHAQLVRTLLSTLTQSETPEQLTDNWQRIAAHFDRLLDRPEAVDALEQTILQLAVRGLLVPQDPRDEPASELLKKIRTEKDKLILEGKIKRDKPLPPIAEDEQPFELPQRWEWVRLGQVAGIERGGSPRPIEAFITDDASGLNWIKIGDTERGGKYITSASQKIKPEGLVKTRMVYPGDFLLTNSMSFGRPYITQIEGCIHDGWLRISPPDSLDKDYLYDLLSSSFIREVFSAAAAGGVVLNLNADKVRGVAIPLPPLAEQSRIVTRIAQLRRLCLELRRRLTASQSTQAHLAEALVENVA